MPTRFLDEPEFRKYLIGPMREAAKDEFDPEQLWDYVAQIPRKDLNGARIHEEVDFVYRCGDGSHDHLLVRTDRAATYLVIVVGAVGGEIVGHRLLDFEYEYGLLAKH